MTDQPLTVVGIGASAGGLEAFHGFFQNMPADNGMAFVVLLHLPGNRKSLLPEILSRWASMPVIEARGGELVEPNHIYVPLPGAIVTLDHGHLNVQVPGEDAPRELRPIDGFFDSLAIGLRENAVGIVLSGTGSDGALGLKAIKECGGLTIAQGADGNSPQHGGMPLGAIATGAVDLIAPVEAIPSHLLRLKGGRGPDDELTQPPPDRVKASRLAICAILRSRLAHDFSGYKEQTFLRRVWRRMRVLNIDQPEDYVERLERDPDEVLLLFRDLLIRVTSFFRDHAAFEVLERVVMPRLFADKHADGTVRVWVPGCATGEEAYSLAILLRERMDRLQSPPKVQVFGTDIDEPAIATARLGRYPKALLEGLSSERRERFFRQDLTGYVVTKEIRDLCTFSPHSIVRDPPFSRMNMVSCRNLLIYMDIGLQSDIIRAFHYSLVPNGVLLLGSSETITRQEELFEPLDKATRIFLRGDIQSPRMPVPYKSSGLPVPRQFTRREGSSPGWPTATTRVENEPPSADRYGQSNGDDGQNRGKPGLGGLLARIRQKLSGNAAREVERLRRGLAATSRQLQSLTEEHQAAVEELRSANEELHSVNEELQSTNEELETSKEEIQSVNEELQTANSQLSENVSETDRANSDLRNLFASTEIATIFLDRHLIIRSFTPAVANIYNLIPTDQGRPLTDVVSQLRYDRLRGDVAEVLDTLRPLERRLVHNDAQSHYLMRILPYRAPDSTVSGILVTFIDVTSIVQAEQHQRLLVDELNHRVRNMLTVVVSLATQTLRRAPSVDAFAEAFLGRIHALTASYTLLSRQQWVSVSLRAVLAEETRPYAQRDLDNIVMEGPDVQLTPKAALALGMMFHELATNAVKHGALSTPEGHVAISWKLDAGENGQVLDLTWAEANGPPVHQPASHGFGTTLIERGFAHELSGRAVIEFDPRGLRVKLNAPAETTIVSQPANKKAAHA
jgi:two-component system CheB/CheR fusion protein